MPEPTIVVLHRALALLRSRGMVTLFVELNPFNHAELLEEELFGLPALRPTWDCPRDKQCVYFLPMGTKGAPD